MGEASGTIARPRELAIVSAAGLVLAILMTWPLASDLAHLGRTLDVDADGQFSIWNIAWVARTLFVDPVHLFDANIYFPHKLTLAYSEANILPGLLGAPIYWASRNPWLTLNAVLLFGFASAFLCAYLLLRYLSGDRRAAAVGAILYAFCPYVFSHLSHIQLLMTGGVPLSMLMLHRLADDPGPRRGMRVGLALAAQALSCAYYGVFTGLMVGFGVVVLAASRRLWFSRAYWTGVATGGGVALACAMPFFMPFLRVQQETGFRRTIEDTARWAAKPHSYLVSSSYAHKWLLDLVRPLGQWNEVLFPGILAVVLGAAGVAIAARRPGRDRETTILYGSLAMLAFWASFGPGAGLYRLLYYLPTFSFLRAPSRLGLVVVLCLAVFASFTLRALFSIVSPRWRSTVAAVAVAAALADLVVYPLQWYRAPTVPAGYAALVTNPRAPVAEFPFYGDRIAFQLHTQYMLFSTAHWMPLVNGYSDVIPADFREAAPILAAFPSDDAFTVLARHRVRYLAVHWDMFAGRDGEVRSRLVKYLPNLRVIWDDGRMSVYEVLRYP